VSSLKNKLRMNFKEKSSKNLREEKKLKKQEKALRKLMKSF
jgi:hypothetical protein